MGIILSLIFPISIISVLIADELHGVNVASIRRRYPAQDLNSRQDESVKES